MCEWRLFSRVPSAMRRWTWEDAPKKRNADEEIDRDWGRKQAEAWGLTSGPIIVPAPVAPPEKSEPEVLSANARLVERMRARRNASGGNNLGNH